VNIVEPIIFQSKINPNSIAICTPGTRMDFVTYAGLARIIDNLGRVALSLGLARGNIVAIHVSDTIFHAALILALTRLGVITVSARTPRLPKELGVHAVIASKSEPFENVGRTILADLNWMFTDGDPLTRDEVAGSDDDDVCRIMLTSGTTGRVVGGMYAQWSFHSAPCSIHFLITAICSAVGCGRFDLGCGMCTSGSSDVMRM